MCGGEGDACEDYTANPRMKRPGMICRAHFLFSDHRQDSRFLTVRQLLILPENRSDAQRLLLLNQAGQIVAEKLQSTSFPAINRLAIYFCRHGHLWTLNISTWMDHEQFAETEDWFVKHFSLPMSRDTG